MLIIRQHWHCQLWDTGARAPPLDFQKFILFCFTLELYKHTHTRLTALFPGLPGWAGTRKVTNSVKALKHCSWSYTKYDGNPLMWIIFSICIPQSLKLVQFSFYWKNERAYRLFLYHGVYLSPILCYYMCVTEVTSMSFCAPSQARSWQCHCQAAYFMSTCRFHLTNLLVLGVGVAR